MKHLLKFSLFESRKERKPKIDLSEYKKTNRCKAECDTMVVHTEEGPKVICTSCKRLIREIKK
jgi:hypothetical protein